MKLLISREDTGIADCWDPEPIAYDCAVALWTGS